MKVFDIETKIFATVERKEFLRPSMFLITDVEEKNLKQAIENNTYYWVENNELKFSGNKPTVDHEWDDYNHTWVLNQSARTARIEQERNLIWERIKEKRYLNSQSGVYVSSVNKWFQSGTEELEKYMVLTHTLKETREKLRSVISQEQLTQQGNMLIPWTCYDNSYIDMTPELLKEILIELTFKNIQDHSCASNHKARLWQSEDPMNYDYSTGWQPSYNGD